MLESADTADQDNGPRSKAAIERMCAVTRQVRPIGELIRFVVTPDGAVLADLKRKLPGRGLWVSCSHETVEQAGKRGVFAKGFRANVKASPSLSHDTGTLMVRHALDALAISAKAGQVVAGFSKVEEAINFGRAAALFHATDGAADGIRKLDDITAAAERKNGGKSTQIPVFKLFAGDELDLALGRSNVVHAALLAGSAGNSLIARCQTLVQFRMASGAAASGKTG